MVKPFHKWTSQEVLDFLRKLKPETRLRILSFVIGGAFSLIFVFWPAWVIRPQIQAEASGLLAQFRVAEAKIAQEPTLLKKREEEEAFIRSTQSRLLGDEGGERLVGILASIAEKSQVALVSTEPGEEQNDKQKLPPPFDKKYRKVSYLVTVEGGYHQLATFVGEVENYSQILRIDEFSVAPKEETPKTHLGQVLISAFTLRQGKEGKA